jgi:hypothetical protein
VTTPRILALDLSLTRTGVCEDDGACSCIRADKLCGCSASTTLLARSNAWRAMSTSWSSRAEKKQFGMVSSWLDGLIPGPPPTIVNEPHRCPTCGQIVEAAGDE